MKKRGGRPVKTVHLYACESGRMGVNMYSYKIEKDRNILRQAAKR